MSNTKSIASIDELKIDHRTGTVIDVQNGVRINTSTTHSTSGRDGYVSSSSTSTHTSDDVMTLFIREDEGAEFTAEFTNSSVAVRVGNRVTVGLAGNKNADRGYYAALVNHDTGEKAVLSKASEWLVPRPSGLSGCLVVLVLLGILIAWPTFGFMLGNIFMLIFGETLGAVMGFLASLVIPVGGFMWLFRVSRRMGNEQRVADDLRNAVLQRVREEMQRLI